jgi:surface antigen
MNKLSSNQESAYYIKPITITKKQLTVLLTVMVMAGTFGRTPQAAARRIDASTITTGALAAQPDRIKPSAPDIVDVGPTIAASASQLPDAPVLPNPTKERLPEMPLKAEPRPAPAPIVRRAAAKPASTPKPVRAAAPAVRAVNGGGYPYANVPFPNTSVDPWGLYKRQCVSYAAWKVSASGRNMPNWSGKGSAYMWDDNARAAGIPVDSTPRVGDVAVKNGGSGHVMYVEAVHGDGTIKVSDYNNDGRGTYGERTRSAAGLVFIHFP